MRWHTAGRTWTWNIPSRLKSRFQESRMVFRLCIVFATAVAVLSPAALASLT
ncbi:hypothetical protein GGR34_003914 [Microvirga flocculans]|uniref:Uncharacterized protein n=1 Tax=Microvirga flocculans TaxID=217168 RepID=A0A7W6NA72_9HYPH|nr:hypothetical protein [Microvirga flocculans]MBB4042225.1 hypothetical protein [Microvirga flocculans]